MRACSTTTPPNWDSDTQHVVLLRDDGRDQQFRPLPAVSDLMCMQGSRGGFYRFRVCSCCTGTLPELWGMNRIGSPAGLIIFLQDNSLLGSLPETWGSLNLTLLSLMQNRLNGTLPVSWGESWPLLSFLDLSENLLSGDGLLACAAANAC